MHSATSRLNAAFGYLVTVLSVVTFACFLSTAFRAYHAPVSLATSEASVKHVPGYAVGEKGEVDLLLFNFDLAVDLAPLFDWNTKELFLFLYVEYITPKNILNQVTIWDSVVLREHKQKVQIRNGNMKYYLLDDGAALRNHNNVTLVLGWNVVPNAGKMPLFLMPSQKRLAVPGEYAQEQA